MIDSDAVRDEDNELGGSRSEWIIGSLHQAKIAIAFWEFPITPEKLNDTNLLRHVRYFYLYLFVFILQAFQVIFSTRLKCYCFMKGLNARFSDPVLRWASVYRTAPLAFFMG